MADKYLFEDALNVEDHKEYFLEKDMLYVLDQNGGSYNGSITFDTSVLSNAQRWLDYKNGLLEIPLQISMSSSVDISAADAVNAYMLGLKNGSHQLIDSLQVEYNNSTVVQLQPFTNFYVGYKLMSSWSQDDLVKHGPSTIFTPDSAGSVNFQSAASVDGIGHCNTIVNPIETKTWSGTSSQLDNHNDGFLQRLNATGFDLTTANSAAYGSLPAIDSASLAQAVQKNYTNDDGGAAAARIYKWNILCTIRLKDVHDFFEQLPLVKGAYLRFTLNYNSCRMQIPVGAGPTLGAPTYTQISGRTNPVMMASASVSNPSASVGAVGAQTLTIEANIAKTSNPAVGSSGTLSSCRLYVPSYIMNPSSEKELLSLRPRQEIVYEEIYNYNFNSVPAGGNFNQIITNGLANAKSLVIVPMINSSSNASVVPYQSPYDSAPGTTCPLAAVTNFNVAVAGKNVFQANVDYDFDMFENEVMSANALNGGLSTGLTSGLLSRAMWDNSYRYVVTDISRGSPISDDIPKSIQVSGKNSTSVAMDFFCFVVYEKKATIDVATSQLLDLK